MPRISVVIPLYQTERYIEAALASVAAQTFTDYEVIVVDDGSRDRGPALAAATGDGRVRVVTQENRGLAGARNTGIRHSRGSEIALLDADDLWAPDKLERHVAHFDGDPRLDVSFSSSALIAEDGSALGLVQSPKNGDLSEEAFFSRNPVGNGSAPVIARRALDRIAFFDSALGRICWFDESFRQSEDVECWLRLRVSANARFSHIAEPLTLYRVNSGGLSADVVKQLATWRRYRDKVAGYAPELVAREGHRAEAYQLRYLARRAVRSDDRRQALELVRQAILRHPRIIVEEPLRTFVTLVAAAAKRSVSASLFSAIERTAMDFASRHRTLRF